MAWGTRFNSEIYLSREKYSSKLEIEENINELENDMIDIIDKIKMFASSKIDDIVPENDEDNPIFWLNRELNNMFMDYDELLIRQYKLNLYLEFLCENPTHDMKEDYDE